MSGAAEVDKPRTAYEHFLFGLLLLGAALLALAVVFIVYDMLARNLGLQPFAHTIAATEYSLLYVTFLGAPWLVRCKRHVYVELVTTLVSPRMRKVIATCVYLLCTLLCALLCYYSASVAIEAFTRGDVEVRSFDMPRWAIFAVMPLSFMLLTVEFGRFLIGRDDLYDSGLGIKE